jgi:glycosyltransferase involved in cell wall biosynthesis
MSHFTVIICTYNRAHLLSRAIQSVLAQTEPDFELLIVDDHSEDETAQVVSSYEDKRIRYLKREQNGGSSATRNEGIRAARGRFIAFLDDDDEYLPDYLAEARQAFAQAPAEVGAIFCKTILVEDDPQSERIIGERVPTPPPHKDRSEASLYLLRRQTLSSGWGLTVRADCFATVGLFDENLEAAVDWDIFIRMARHVDFHVIPRALVKQHKHAGPQLTDPTPRRYRARARILQKNLEAFRHDPVVYAELCSMLSLLHYRAGDKAEARKVLSSVLRRSPANWRSWRRLLLGELLGALPAAFQVKAWRAASKL